MGLVLKNAFLDPASREALIFSEIAETNQDFPTLLEKYPCIVPAKRPSQGNHGDFPATAFFLHFFTA